MARDAIAKGATVVHLFPIYEEKIKEGQEVKQVRLVANGRVQANFPNIYASTPSKEELYILLHVAAVHDWDIVHLDEKRAFLTAKYSSEVPAFAQLKGDPHLYSIIGALYGLRTSPRDYQDKVVKMCLDLGYTRSQMCRCIYFKKVATSLVILFHHVDDFILTGGKGEVIESEIASLRQYMVTTDPIHDPTAVLGLSIKRDRNRRIISIDVADKIADGYKRLSIERMGRDRQVHVPIPRQAYLISDDDFAKGSPEDAVFLPLSEIRKYQAIVGFMIWVVGVRYDVSFALLYLSWANCAPRVHHMRYAHYAMNYLLQHKDLPLVLGGDSSIQVTSFTDASLGTAPKGKSVLAGIHRLNQTAGAIIAKSMKTQSVWLSSFEAELDGVSQAMKDSSRITNILEELSIELEGKNTIFCDNQAVIEFVKGNNNAQKCRHMDLRLFYIRDKLELDRYELVFMPGAEIPTDKLTKLAVREDHEVFTKSVLGLGLLAVN